MRDTLILTMLATVLVSCDANVASNTTTTTEGAIEWARYYDYAKRELQLTCRAVKGDTCHFRVAENGSERRLAVTVGRLARVPNVTSSAQVCATANPAEDAACDWNVLVPKSS